MAKVFNLQERAKLLKRPDASQLVGVCPRTLQKFSKPHGPIPVVRIGRAVRYRIADLEKFIADQIAAAEA